MARTKRLQSRAVAAVNLGSYGGSTGVLVDTNIWVDCIDSKSCWHEWAIEQLQVCSERATLHVNLIIYTELLVPGPNTAALDELLDVYRRRGGARTHPLPDFVIGAHAAAANLSVPTRDSARYASFFPGLVLLAP